MSSSCAVLECVSKRRDNEENTTNPVSSTQQQPMYYQSKYNYNIQSTAQHTHLTNKPTIHETYIHLSLFNCNCYNTHTNTKTRLKTHLIINPILGPSPSGVGANTHISANNVDKKRRRTLTTSAHGYEKSNWTSSTLHRTQQTNAIQIHTHEPRKVSAAFVGMCVVCVRVSVLMCRRDDKWAGLRVLNRCNIIARRVNDIMCKVIIAHGVFVSFLILILSGLWFVSRYEFMMLCGCSVFQSGYLCKSRSH